MGNLDTCEGMKRLIDISHNIDTPLPLPFSKLTASRQSRMRQVLICVIFEVFTAVTMKNIVYLDVKTQFIPYRGHITSPLQSPAG
jgi:hypothetical protein